MSAVVLQFALTSFRGKALEKAGADTLRIAGTLLDGNMDLDYTFLDALLSRGPANVTPFLAEHIPTVGSRIGPLMEYAYTRLQNSDCALPSLSSLGVKIDVPTLEACIQRRSDGLTITSLDPRSAEIAPLPIAIAANGYWSAFVRRLINAAIRSGIDNPSAKGIGAAFSELAENAIDHSGRPASTTVAYRWAAGEFEMVIADSGIGIRESLRKNPEHSDMDDQVALEQATTMGVTRYPSGSGHGTGFKTVFDSIAALSGLLRFRSGTAALILNGTNLGAIARKSCQRQYFQGFFAAICCRL